tara:strand:+ start:1406 stop:1684 length:279 start_codon:yes stop_codon:yes gene_type:complete
LAWEAARDDINGNSIPSKNVACEFGNVFIAWHSRPMFSQNLAREWLYFAECYGFKSARAFKAKAKSADAAEKIKDAQFFHHFTCQLWDAIRA